MCVRVCVQPDSSLLGEGRGHGVGHHRLRGLLVRLGWLRRVKGERRVIHSILGWSLIPLEWLVLEVLTPEVALRVPPVAVVSLSVAVAVITVAIVATAPFIVAASPIVVAVLHLWPAIVTPVRISIPIATEISPTPTGIPVPAVVLVASPTTSGTTSSVLGHLQQFGVDGLIGLPEDRDKVVGLFHVVRCKEGVGRASFLTAGRTPDSVDIILRGVRVVIIDDKFHILHICKVLQCGKKGGMWQHFLHTTTATPKKDKLAHRRHMEQSLDAQLCWKKTGKC